MATENDYITVKRIKNMEKNIDYLASQLDACNTMIQASAKGLAEVNRRIAEMTSQLDCKKPVYRCNHCGVSDYLVNEMVCGFCGQGIMKFEEANK